MCYVGSALTVRNKHYDNLSFPDKKWTLSYKRKNPGSGSEGGKFWIQIKGNLQ